MSVCRWSSDNYSCDLYIYETDGGFSVNVASNRPAGDIPEVPVPPPVTASSSDWDRWFAPHCAQLNYLDNADRVQIGGPYDGSSLDHLAADEVLDLLNTLHGAGYRFPSYVLEAFSEPS